MRLDVLEAALAEAARDQPPVSPVDPHRLVARVRRRRLLGAAVLAVGVTTATVAAVATVGSRSDPTRIVAGPPDLEDAGAQPDWPDAATVGADEVVARARAGTGGRVDRIEAKLVRWEFYERSAQPGPGVPTTPLDPERLVWVVVVGGELRAPHPPPNQDPRFSGGVLIVGRDGTTIGSSLKAEGAWPDWFSGLPDWGRPVRPRSEPAPDSVRERADPDAEPAAPCDTTDGRIATVILHDDVPEPRCLRVRGDQRIELVNQTRSQVTVRVAQYEAVLAAGEMTMFDRPIATYLEPGVHVPSGSAPMPEIWLR